ncbi:GNAT family N-acetyltransferase [Bacillus salitolerans]|uniref:GNAT family N-acetyltransferase n=1 Tax=Bacillus salitolerans TaxID=1437434 RepID=A0ABW4LSU9_9BACI
MMMDLPILTVELANRMERIDFEVLRDRMQAVQLRKGNPNNVEIKSFGKCMALSADDMPREFNKVWFFSEDDISRLDDMVAYYKERNLPFSIDITPVTLTGRLAKELNKKGFYQHGFHSTLFGAPSIDNHNTMKPIRILKAGKEEMSLFSSLFSQSLEIPFDIPENNESFSILHNNPEWSFYIGYVNEIPAGFSMLYIGANGIACLGMAGTLPAFRGHGLQLAMLKRRLMDAKERLSHIIVAQCEFGTPSFRNLQRVGLKVAYTKSVWYSPLP